MNQLVVFIVCFLVLTNIGFSQIPDGSDSSHERWGYVLEDTVGNMANMPIYWQLW